MRRLKAEFQDIGIVEKGLLARLLTHPEERTVIGLIITREDFDDPVLGRLFSAAMLWGAAEIGPFALELHKMFLFCGDEEAAHRIVDLAMAPFPDSYAELVMLAVYVHDQACYRENVRLEEEARRYLYSDESERDKADGQSDDDMGW